MSRSYKKTPIRKNGTGCNWFYKRQANKKIRQDKQFDECGCKYRHKNDSAEIYECSFRFYGNIKSASWKDKKDYMSK